MMDKPLKKLSPECRWPGAAPALNPQRSGSTIFPLSNKQTNSKQPLFKETERIDQRKLLLPAGTRPLETSGILKTGSPTPAYPKGDCQAETRGLSESRFSGES